MDGDNASKRICDEGEASSAKRIAKSSAVRLKIVSGGDAPYLKINDEAKAANRKSFSKGNASHIQSYSELNDCNSSDELIVHFENKKSADEYKSQSQKNLFDRCKERIAELQSANSCSMKAMGVFGSQIETFQSLSQRRSEYELVKHRNVYNYFTALAKTTNELEKRNKLLKSKLQNIMNKTKSRTETMNSEIEKCKETIKRTQQSFERLCHPVKEVYENSEKLVTSYCLLPKESK